MRPYTAQLWRLPLVLACVCGLAIGVGGVRAQDGGGLALADARGDEAAGDEAKATEPDQPIRFNFSNAPYSEVITFFERESGLPIIKQASVPQAGMTFISGGSYSFESALDILNRFLLPHKVRLTREEDYLYLRSVEDAARQPGAIYQGELPEQVREGEIVTLAVPLTNVDAQAIADQLKAMVAAYGSLVPVPTQNLLIITETAEQLRKIRQIVQLVDAQPPSSSDYKVYPLTVARAGEVVGTLRKLVPEYEKKIEKSGNRIEVIDDVSQPPVRFEPNERANSIIAIGPTRRLVQAGELIEMLDQSEGAGDGDRRMASFVLEGVTPRQAAQQLDKLFSSVPPDRRPTILPIEELSKITIVGRQSLVLQAEALLGEIDPGLGREGDREGRVSRVVALERVDASAAERTVRRLLSPRQQQALRWAALEGGEALIVAGPARDVEQFESLVSTIDQQQELSRDVRVVEVSRGDPQALADRAAELLELGGGEPVRADVDAQAREVTVAGSPESVGRFVEFMRQGESSVTVSRVSRVFTLSSARPAEVAPKLARVADAMLRPADGSAYEAPRFEAVEELDQVVVHATEEQLGTIEGLFAQLDRPSGGWRFLVFPVRNTTPEELLERVRPVYQAEADRREDPTLDEITLTPDSAAGAIVVRGSAEATELFRSVLDQVQRLVPPARTTRFVELEFADATELAPELGELIANREPVDPSRSMPPPEIAVVERTNTLMVTAEPAQHQLVVDLVRRLDTVEPTALPPLRLLQLRAANAGNIARMLGEQYAQRPQADRVARPVDVRADEATNTLIVSAHEDLFAEIKTFVEEINRESVEGPERAPLLFRLSVAKAPDVAEAMNQLYPEPPIPLDRRGRPMPWLQQPRQVTVSADEGSNSLIIDAPTEMHDSLRELAQQLDKVQVPPTAELRTYRVVDADVSTIKRVLEGMARQGNLSAPAQAGRQAVRVTVEAEPRSGTLIVAGDEVTFERVEAVLEDLAAVPEERELAIVPIVNADAEAVGERALSIYKAQVAGVPGAGEVELSVNTDTNALEVVADAEALERFLGVLDMLQDQAGPPREARLVQLQQARAGDVITFLEDLVASSTSLSSQGGPDPVFEAIESTNAILVAAIPSQFGIIEQLVRDLDRQQSAGRQPLRILRLRTTDATSIARVLEDSFQRRTPEERARRPVDIEADAATNTLLVSAHPEVLPEIEAIVGQLNDTRAVGDEDREIRIFPLKHARAEELARTIDEMYPEPPMPRDSRGRPRPDLQQPKEVVVRASPGTNSLIVDAPARRLTGFEQIVSSLDRPELASDVTLRTYRPQRADPQALSRAIRELADSGALGGSPRTPVSVSVEPATRALIVSGPAEVFERVEALLEELDGAPARAEASVKLYRVVHARAERLEPLLRDLLTTRLREKQAVEGGLGVADVASLLRVSADRATNTLVISAPPVAQELAQSLIEALDTEQAGAGGPVVRVVPLSYGRADQIAPQLERAIEDLVLPGGGPVRISPVGGANALVLTGAKADIELVDGLVDELDTRPFDPDAEGVRTFELTHADAGRIAPVVERLLVRQRETNWLVLRELIRRDPSSVASVDVRVEADGATNTLLVSGPAETVALAEDLVSKLDRPAVDADRAVLTYAPARAPADRLAQTVSRLAASTIDAGRGELEITAEPVSGTVVVVGAESAAARAIELLRDFDERSPAVPAADVRIVSLEHATASTVAQTIEPLLADRARWPEELVRAERAGLAVPRPTVRADQRGNRLILSVPSRLRPTADELIAALDTPAAGEADVRVRLVRLREGDASSVAEAVGQALRAGVPQGMPQPTVRAEPTSNSVVIAASPGQLDEAERLIGEMDAKVQPEGVDVLTLRLRNTRAESIAPIVEAVVQQESVVDLLPWWAVSNFAAQNPDRAVKPTIRVLPEPQTNTLVVVAPRPVLELAEQVVAELDSAQGAPDATRPVRLIPLRNADAAEVAQNLEAVVDRGEGAAGPPVIRVDRGSNALIVRATVAQMEQIERLAGELDKATLTSSRQMRLIPIDRSKADASMIAQTLRQLLERQGGVRVEVVGVDELLGDPGEAAEPIGPGSALPAGERPFGDGPSSGVGWPGTVGRLVLAAALTQPQGGEVPGDDQQGEPDEPASADARDGAGDDTGDDADDDPDDPPPASPASSQDAPEPDADTPQAAEQPAAVTIAVDPATNALVVVGSPRMTDRLASLADQIQRQTPRAATRVRVVRLPSTADANAIAQIVRQTVQRVGVASADNPSGFTGRPDVVPDPAGASLIVWANDADFEVIGELVGSVARLDASERLTVRVYPLVNIDAAAAARSLNDLVSAQPTGMQARRFRRSGAPARASDLTLVDPQGRRVSAEVDPASVRVMADPSGTRLVVTSPADAVPLIDAFVSLVDQSPLADRLAIRRYDLRNADADQLSRAFGRLFDAQRQGPGGRSLPRASFVADDRTNALLVTASSEQHAEIERLLADADAEAQDDGLELAILPLQNARPQTVRQVVADVLIGRDPGRADELHLSADDDAGVLVVRATPELLAEARSLAEELDASSVEGAPIRTISLETADAPTVASAIQDFLRDRAQAAGRGRRGQTRVSIVGERRSGTLIVAASDEDFEQVRSLAEELDTPAASRDLRVQIVRIENGRAKELDDAVNDLVGQLFDERVWGGGRGQQSPPEDKLYTSTHEPSNSIVVVGQGETMDLVLGLIRDLDTERSDVTRTIVRTVPVENADLNAIAQVIRNAFQERDVGRFWVSFGQSSVSVSVDAQRRLLILVGEKAKVEQAVEYATTLAATPGIEDRAIELVPLRYADARRAERTLTQFFRQKAANEGRRPDAVTIIGSADGNVLMVSAEPEDLSLLEDMVAQIDQPDLPEGRRIEVFALRTADPGEAGQAIRSMIPGRPGEQGVRVTPQPSRNAIIVSAQEEQFPLIEELIGKLDTDTVAPFVSVQLDEARAQDVARTLREALPQGFSVEITAVDRTNTVIVSGGNEQAVSWVRDQIAQLDVASGPPPTEFRRVQLEHATASDVWVTLLEASRAQARERGEPEPGIDYNDRDNTVLLSATPDDMRQLLGIVEQLDVPTGGERTTQFVKLEYAEADLVSQALGLFYGRRAAEAKSQAAREVTILPDPVTNTLIIAASEDQWDGIRSLLEQFDTEDYATGRQLRVIPLRNADARNVADALNEGFRAPLERQIEQERARRERRPQREQRQPFFDPPPVLIDAGETPVVSAEVQTNSLIVFANAQDLTRIEAIAKTLDSEDAGGLPGARVIALSSGRASAIAQAVQRIYIEPLGRRGPRSPVVFGDDASNTIIFRGSEGEFAQVSALVRTLETEGADTDVRVRTLAVRGVPAARMRDTLVRSFTVRARELGEGLGIEVDRDANALVIASSERLYTEIQEVVRTLQDAAAGGQDDAAGDGQAGGEQGMAGFGRSLRIVDLSGHAPAEMAQLAGQLGLTRPSPADDPGLLAEPITIVPLPTRNAVAVVATDADIDRAEQIVRSLDEGGVEGAQSVALVPLKYASAAEVAGVVREMLTPRGESGQPPAARALAEQVRRRRLEGGGEGAVFDLGVPVQLVPEGQSNSLLIASSKANVRAVADLVRTLDTLPVGDAVVARIFPLQNADAGRIQSLVNGLFRQGEAIRRLPGTQRQGEPTTATGQALAGEIAIAVDARTNSLIVAGREEAVAFVEVLLADLDSEESVGWLEPAIVALEHADAVDLAELLNDILVDGLEDSPAAAGLREQVGRLRMAAKGEDPADPASRVDSDLFAPLTGLTILPEANTNSLVVVASPANLAIVRELVSMLDVPSAAAGNSVRIYTLDLASADRVAGLIEGIFRDRQSAGVGREEDRVAVRADLRTNSLVVSTSPRSFSILDDLIPRLDRDEGRMTVGLHTLDVTGADAAALAPRIERLMRDRIEAASRDGQARSAEDVFSVEASPGTNQLLVVASEENVGVVRGLVESLTSQERRLSDAGEIELISLERGPVEQVVQAITTLYVQPENERRGEGSVSVVPVVRNNALLVSGTAKDVARVRELATQLDVADVVQQQHLRRVELESADAREVVALLQDLLSGDSVAGRAGASATIIEYRRRLSDAVQGEDGDGGDGEREVVLRAAIDESLRRQISIEADERTNAVTVMSPPEIMDLILAFIDEVDRSEADDRILEYFELKNADAEQMAVILQELFSLRRQGDQFILVPSRRVREEQEDEPPGPRLTPVTTERERLSITIDFRTNTLIVSATKEYLELVRDVVQRLDRIEATEREEVVYALQNAQADQVEQVLSNYFDDQADRFRQLLNEESGESINRILDREVIVVGDPTSNKVVVSVSPRYVNTVNEIIAELDSAPPQVLVQALIAEVTLDEDATWGLDFDLFDFGGDMYSFALDAAGSGVATAVGLPNLSLTSADFGLAVRALEGQGRLEVLSRPVIQINNNEEGNILVGEDIAIIESVDTFENGRVQANVIRREVGVEMTVRPSISTDGFVRLEIEPAISSVSSQVTQISDDFAAPIISRREVQTTVTVRNGETVIIGGLIQSLNDDRQTRIPPLGRIPGLGWLLGTNERSSRRTELLIVLTPRIIPGGRQGVADAREVTSEQLFRHHAASTRIFERSDVSGLSPKKFDPDAPLRQDPPADGSIGPPLGPYPVGEDPQGDRSGQP